MRRHGRICEAKEGGFARNVRQTYATNAKWHTLYDFAMSLKQDPQSNSPAACSPKVVSTEDVPEKDRLAYWLDVARAIYCTLEFEAPGQDRLRGSIGFTELDRLTLSHVRCNAGSVRHIPARSHTDDDSFVALLLLSGEGEIRQHGRSSLLKPGDMVIHDCIEPYQLVFGDMPHTLYGVRVPRAELVRTVTDPEDLTALVVPSSQVPAQMLRTMLDELHRNASRLPPSSVSTISDALISTVAAGLRCLPQALSPATKGLAAYHLARIRDHVRQHLADPDLCVGTVAAAVGLSPDHVSRLFRQQSHSLAEWIWQERLEACRNALADPRLAKRSVSEIAYTWGFNDAAHFSRRFRQAHGMSPREWRAVNQARHAGAFNAA